MIEEKLITMVLDFIYQIHPFISMFVLSLLISVIVTLVYKYFTNQTEMKRLKDQQKEFQKRMKELRSNPEEMMKVQKEAMKTNMEYMKHSFKPMLITMIPILLIFSWMGGIFQYDSIQPGETYTVTAYFKEGINGIAKIIPDNQTKVLDTIDKNISEGKASWSLKSEEGTRLLTVSMEENEKSRNVLITSNSFKTIGNEKPNTHSDIERVDVNYNQLTLLEWTGIPWVKTWGWVGTYIVFSLIFSLALRKVFKLY